MSAAVDVVQRQLEAYNARDIDAFVAAFAPSIRIFRMPAAEPAIVGHAKFREAYTKRFASAGLHAEILDRIVLGNKVIDHERIRGITDGLVEAVAVYEVVDGLIETVWFFYPEKK